MAYLAGQHKDRVAYLWEGSADDCVDFDGNIGGHEVGLLNDVRRGNP